MRVSQLFVTTALNFHHKNFIRHTTKQKCHKKVYMLNPNPHSQHDYLFVFSVILPLVEERMIVLLVTTPARSAYLSGANGSSSTPH